MKGPGQPDCDEIVEDEKQSGIVKLKNKAKNASGKVGKK